MKYITVLICCLALIACEDDAKETTLSDDLVGTWSITNMGQYANADCSGELDYTGWALITAFGVTMDFVFDDDGTGAISSTAFGMTESDDFTWTVDGDQVCIDDECETLEIVDDTFTVTASEDAYCEDDMGEEIDGMTMTSCEAAGYEWNEAVCYEFTATKQ